MKSSESGNTTYNRKKWSILFIGEDGKVVTVKHFKGMVTGLALLLTILILFLVFLYFQYRSRAEYAESLRKDVADVAAENRSLKDEKDQMLARLVILESELKAREQQPEPAQGIGKLPGKAEPRQEVAKEASAQVAERENDPKDGQKQASTTPAVQGGPQAPPISIANKNLIVCQDPTSDNMRVEYKVINTGAKDAPVAGRSVIVLKGDNMNSEDWIVLPNVPLSDLKPSGERGKRFRIYNFRTIKYKVPSSEVKGRLETATIFTFTESGTFVAERDYPIEMSVEMCP
jgi:hypothetical protein